MRLSRVTFPTLLLGLPQLLLVADGKAAMDLTNAIPVADFTLQPPYVHSEFHNRNWLFGGNSMVSVNEYIRLTGDKPSQSGWAFSKKQLSAPAWTIEFRFKIHGKDNSLHADGLAFWYTKDTFQPGSVFGNKDQFEGLGVFFDTFPNGAHDHTFPFISAMVGDGKLRYDHDNDNKASMIGHGCEAGIRGEPVFARVTHYENSILEVEISTDLTKDWQKCFVVSNVTLPSAGYIGFSSVTGALSDNHDILQVVVYQAQAPDYSREEVVQPNYGHETMDESAGNFGHVVTGGFFSMLWTVVKWIGLGSVVAVGVVAYKRRAEQSMKKF